MSLAEDYTSILDDIVTGFNTAAPTMLVEKGYGQGVEAFAQQDIISAQGFRNVITKVDDLPESTVHRNTFGAVKEGRVMMWSIADSDRAALQAFKLWWLILCGDNGNILHNVKTQKALGALTVQRWRAVGGSIPGFAMPTGNLWYVDQLVEFTVKT